MFQVQNIMIKGKGNIFKIRTNLSILICINVSWFILKISA